MNTTINTIYNMDCIEGMKTKLEDSSVDLIITSPPYDDLRTYESGTSLHEVGKECFRVLKEGGVLAMVIQDGTKDRAKTVTTFRTAVDYVDNIGFKLFETVIWQKDGRPGVWWNKRFRVDHEYVLIFFKGKEPQFFDKEDLKIPSKHAGKTAKGTTRLNDGSTKENKEMVVKDKKCRGTIWNITNSKSERNELKLKHPATFPDQLVKDLVSCFSGNNMLIVDPFLGSGTTCFVAKEMGRNYIGFEISEEYYNLAINRLGGNNDAK